MVGVAEAPDAKRPRIIATASAGAAVKNFVAIRVIRMISPTETDKASSDRNFPLLLSDRRPGAEPGAEVKIF
jgi:hypothetical protein